MSRFITNLTVLLSIMLLVTAVGCNDQKEQLKTAEEEAQAAAERINELQRLLDLAKNDLILSEDEALALRTERDKLAAELANSGTDDGWKRVPGGAMISIEGNVLFDSGEPTLRATAKTTLDQIASAIEGEFAGHDIYVFGHTDDQPIRKSGWEDNYELSCQRALSVVRYLRDAGASQYLAACGWGQYRPVADNANAPNRQANRRVEIFALTPRAVSGSASAARR